MKRLLYVFVLIALLAALVQCTTPAEEPAATPVPQEEEAPAETKTMIVGYTTSQTGKYNVSSTRQVNGLKQWMEAVNAAGGIELSDGTIIKFTDQSYDDESNKERVQELYTRLATEDEADFLISPYSSGLTAAAAVIAEQYGKVMITTGAASDSAYKEGYTLVFQAYTPASRYLTGAVDLLASLDSEVNKIAIVYENTNFATSVVEAAKAYAEDQGYQVVLFEGYDAETADFGPFINKILESGAEVILGGGHFQDGSTFARQIHEKNVDIKLFTLLVPRQSRTLPIWATRPWGLLAPASGNLWPNLPLTRPPRPG